MLNPNLHSDAVEKLREGLESLVIGQPKAIDAIVNTYELHTAGLSGTGQPIANFFFLGPTGTGKTKTVEALAEVLHGNPKGFLKIDCAEYQHSHEIAKLVGSPPGYLGHRETHPYLAQAAVNAHFTSGGPQISLILFDEIEKASDALWNLLLGILDKAVLSLGDNKVTDFSRSMIFLTSNVGADKIQNLLDTKVGFHQHQGGEDKFTTVGVEALRRKFSPEFMNRLDRDNIVTYNPLSSSTLMKILDLELANLQARLHTATAGRGIGQAYIVYTPEAKQFLVEKGFDKRYGARPLVQAVKSYVARPVAALLGSGQLKEEVVVDAGDEGLTFSSFEKELKAA